nr:Hint domain-containing protein [Nannocystis pusilla]
MACGRAADGTLSPVTGPARWGHSGATCFATGTPIDTPAGPVAIEALAPGATVLSFDVLRGEAQVAHVLRRVSRGERPVLQLRLADGRALRITGEHPLWLPRVGVFRPARDLQVGDRLLGRDGAALPIESIVPDGTSEVWELSVDAPDTYFADGFLAHNTDCGAGWGAEQLTAHHEVLLHRCCVWRSLSRTTRMVSSSPCQRRSSASSATHSAIALHALACHEVALRSARAVDGAGSDCMAISIAAGSRAIDGGPALA